MEEKFTILAVDDNSISLATIEQELKRKYNVVPVNSGVRALQYLKQKTPPDLILLDVQMALKDGVETLRDIRKMENCEKIPVIMLTKKKKKNVILESSKLGINDYVLKPFNAQDLHDRIERVLNKKETIEHFVDLREEKGE